MWSYVFADKVKCSSFTSSYLSCKLKNLAFSFTYVVDFQSKVLCDPILDLFQVVPSSVTIVVGNNGRIHRIVQRGMCMPDSLQKMVALALGRQKLVADSLLEAQASHCKMRPSKEPTS